MKPARKISPSVMAIVSAAVIGLIAPAWAERGYSATSRGLPAPAEAGGEWSAGRRRPPSGCRSRSACRRRSYRERWALRRSTSPSPFHPLSTNDDRASAQVEGGLARQDELGLAGTHVVNDHRVESGGVGESDHRVGDAPPSTVAELDLGQVVLRGGVVRMGPSVPPHP